MNRTIIFSFIIIASVVFGSCAAPTFTAEMEPSGTKIIKGYFERSVIEEDTHFSWNKTNYDSYHPDSATIAELKPLMKDIHFLLVVGTWCGDSKREMPHTFKILDALSVSEGEIQYFGVDRSKKSTDGTTDKFTISRVPTLIVLRGDEELGRIVESPRSTQEKDLLRILQK
jgi:hypothetical protein